MLRPLSLCVHANIDLMATFFSRKDVSRIPGVLVTLDTSRERNISIHLDRGKLKSLRNVMNFSIL